MPGPADSHLSDFENRLLMLLPNGERERLIANTQRIPLRPHDMLHPPGKRITHVYFPLTGVVSLMTPMEGGEAIETATIGNEGMVGVHAFLGGGIIGNAQAMAQVSGEALKMDADHFRGELEGDGKLRQVMFAYVQALFTQISQGVACNALHSVQDRCARWLLETHDRVSSDRFVLTQEFLADMLGVRRPSVTVAARGLQQAGIIRYSRGQITVLDRLALEEASCECYQVVQDEYKRLVMSS